MKNIALIVTTLALCACARNQTTASATSADAAPAESAAPTVPAAPATPPHHHADIAPTQGNQAQGKVELISLSDGVRVTGTITGLAPNSEHGFHVHEKGDCSAPDASSAGGHFNPASQQHGNPDAPPHHAGDIHNIKADAQGTAQVDAQLSGVTISTSGPNDILGKAVVVHEKADDYKTQPSGNSGGRIACGVIQ
jgi:Cu-Zn family superoxide dismutase